MKTTLTTENKSPGCVSGKCAVAYEFDLQPTCTVNHLYYLSALRLRLELLVHK